MYPWRVNVPLLRHLRCKAAIRPTQGWLETFNQRLDGGLFSVPFDLGAPYELDLSRGRCVPNEVVTSIVPLILGLFQRPLKATRVLSASGILKIDDIHAVVVVSLFEESHVGLDRQVLVVVHHRHGISQRVDRFHLFLRCTVPLFSRDPAFVKLPE